MTPWTKFERAAMPEFTDAKLEWQAKEFGIPFEELKKIAEHERSITLSVWLNSLYQVSIQKTDPRKDWPAMIHLSIKRRDKDPIHDWRDLQRIKNELIGPDHEAIELYPSEDRVVDTANQYHLWVFKDPKVRVPVGWTSGMKMGTSTGGVKQRPFEPEDIS